MSPINGTVVHINFNFFTKQLLRTMPNNRIGVHRHAGILGIIHQRITNSLYICTIGANFMINPHLTVHRIRIQMISNQPQCISMHKKAVTLRIINSNSTLSCQSIASKFIVETIISSQHVPILHVIFLFTVSFICTLLKASP